MKDCIIIGGGPAGVSAAINLKLRGKDFVWLAGKNDGKLKSAELIRNYPALPDVTGKQLAWAMDNHTKRLDIEKVEEVASAVYDLGGNFAVTAGETTYEARTVILCIGVTSFKKIAGEDDFVGKGVSYCATCDGFLYKNKTVAALVYNKSFEEEARFLCTVAQKVYILPFYNDCKINGGNAEIVMDAPLKIEGGARVESIAHKNGKIAVDGVFILRPFVAPDTLLHGLETDKGQIITDRAMRTNIAGVFAAGDCTGRPYQYAKSVGEGNIAAHSVIEYLAKN